MKIFRYSKKAVMKSLLVTGMVLASVAALGQPDWSVNTNDYPDYTEVFATVFVGGTPDTTGILGAFINGECRGVEPSTTYWPMADTTNFNIYVYSLVASGETIHFMFYDAESGITYAINETIISDQQNPQGLFSNPLSFTTYQDTESPTVTSCPADISVGTDPGICGAVVTYTEPVFADNALGGGISGELVAGLASGSEFPLGTTTVTYSYTDEAGNPAATCSFDVTVNDTAVPVPDAVSLSDIIAECSVTSLTAPTATDVCDGQVTGTHNATLPITTQGTTVVTWTFTDLTGNTSTQTQNVVLDDLTDPVPAVDPLPDVTAQCAVSELTAPTASDNCAGTVTVTHNATLPITAQGTTVVTWTYDDGNGNTVTQNQNVVLDDTAAPVPDVIPLPDVIAQCEVTELTAPTATDNCVGTVTATTTDPLTYTTQGTYTVNWTYDDGNGNVV
ncbi:MAG: HYR domain-containing protein, partial [Bacteroidales bacterium]|nr:HYR domain-containing protein [Bacteroidales bacterium]